MTILKLAKEEADTLAEYPETGMGFQLMEVPISGLGSKIFLVLNSQYLIPAPNKNEMMAHLQQIASKGVEALDKLENVEKASIAGKSKLIASRLDPEFRISPEAKTLLNEQPLLSVIKSPIVAMYFRFSPYPNDRRVRRDGSFTKGTYATTYNDIRMIPSGFSAVARYALPNPLPAIYIYPIVTATAPVHIGAVVPNFGQAGGGVEVCFPGGATMLTGTPHLIPSG
jgi:hypothetical protein